jgi:ABC-2 type transport system ATP-binding protein
MEINLESVTKRYGRIEALKGISLEIKGSGLVSILGSNGAGKTTLFKVITSIAKPTSGRILVDDIDVNLDPKKVLSRMGSLVEQPEFYTYLTGRELIEFTAQVKGLRGAYLRDEVRRVSELMGISEYIDRRSGGYSRGMKQRLGVAVALVGDPEILILDEPTFGMDPRGMLETRNMLKKIKAEKDKLIIMSTHLLDEARELSDRIVVLRRGEIKFDSLNSANISMVKVVGKVDNGLSNRYAKLIETGEGYAIFELYDRSKLPEFNRELLLSDSKIEFIIPADSLENQFLKE